MAKPKQKQKNLPQKKEETKKGWKNIHYILIISVLALTLYFPTLNYKFTYDDDTALVKDNYDFLNKTSSIPDIFTQSVFYNTYKVQDNYYRPFLILSYFIDTQIAGKHYWFFYLVDILLHLACCILLFFTLQKLTFDKIRSFLFAALFTVHPAFPQAIAWLPGRNDTLLTLFALLSFIFLIDYCKRKKTIYLILHFLFLLISCFTKESAIFLPLIFILYLFLWKDERPTIAKRISNCKWPILLWIMAVFFSMFIRKSVLSVTVGFPLSFIISNLLANLPAIIQYIGKMMIPVNLNTLPVLKDIPIYYGLLVIFMTIFFIWKSKTRNYKRMIFGFVWMILFLIPSIMRTSSSTETLFLEHRLYFPIIGFFLIWGETDLIRRFQLKEKISLLIFIPVMIIFFAAAWVHRGDYRDEYHFWKSAAEGSPHSSVALRGMALYYMDNKETDKAEKLYLQCLALNPDITEVRNNLGRIYMDRGDNDAAEKFFLEEIEINPMTSLAYYNLGHLRFTEKKYAEAEQMFRKSLEIDSSDVVTKNDLAACLGTEGKYEEAVKTCISILEEYPDWEYPKDYLKQIFPAWNDTVKVKQYKEILAKKGISY